MEMSTSMINSTILSRGQLSDPPKIVPLINRDYSLTFGKKRYEKDTIFGDANSHDSTIA
jgi:hypothetical protein